MHQDPHHAIASYYILLIRSYIAGGGWTSLGQVAITKFKFSTNQSCMHNQQATPYEVPLLIHKDPPGFGDPVDWHGRPLHYLFEPKNTP